MQINIWNFQSRYKLICDAAKYLFNILPEFDREVYMYVPV